MRNQKKIPTPKTEVGKTKLSNRGTATMKPHINVKYAEYCVCTSFGVPVVSCKLINWRG